MHGRSRRQVPQRFSERDVFPRLVVCSDNVEAGAEDAKDQLGFEKRVTDWEEVIDDPEVEAVNITAPNHLHLEIVWAVADAEKHIS